MKKIGTLLAIVAVGLSFTFSSCTVEKRQYVKGYHIDWFNKTKTTEAKEQVAVNQTKENATSPAIEEQTSTTNPTTLNGVASKETPAVKSTSAFTSKAPTKIVATAKEFVQEQKAVVKQNKQAKKGNTSKPGDKPSKGLLILLAILIPWLAVGLVTNWDVKQVVINLLLCLTCIGGIIHAIIVVNREA
ncbi:MAG: YqaE/Pmp3 family membrane protein [Bacteroidia bacterium]